MDALVSQLRAGMKRYATYRRMVSELRSLSQSELDDIGLGTSEIANVARHAVYG